MKKRWVYRRKSELGGTGRQRHRERTEGDKKTERKRQANKDRREMEAHIQFVTRFFAL